MKRVLRHVMPIWITIEYRPVKFKVGDTNLEVRKSEPHPILWINFIPIAALAVLALYVF